MAAALVPHGRAHLVPETQVGPEDEVVRALLEVAPDLRLTGVAVGPVRIGRERERVEVRGHVARAPGITVVAPRPPDVVRALQEDEVGEAFLLQANRGAQAAEAAPDDG